MPKGKPHSDELKARAVKAATAPGVKLGDVAKQLKISPGMLGRWVREAGKGKPRKSNVNGTDKKSVLKTLEAEEVRIELALSSIRETIRTLKAL